MDVEKPEWFDEWVIQAPGAWRLREEAPAEVAAEFREFMQLLKLGQDDR
ncbi:hypothetical protein [Bacillus sp. AG4(2022)]|nr:hypothetical protein [Bacillus sp. AG4(2022)]MDT0161872.1 hypothetical protein [Bacillus sp. AG4(2022)]